MNFARFKVLAVSFSVVACCTPVMAGGWLSRATGGRVRTPDAIRKIAPNGISFKSREDTSWSGAISTGYRIRQDGYLDLIQSGGRSDGVFYRGKSKIRAQRQRINGRYYWVHKKASNSPLLITDSRYLPKTQPNNYGYHQHQNPYKQFGPGLTPQQMKYQQSMQRQQQMVNEYYDIERRAMQRARQNMVNGINQAMQQNRRN